MREVNYFPPKGMRDIEPLFAEIRNNAIEQIVAIYKAYGFHLIETPVLEKLENLIGQKGGENEKLIFKILKRGFDFSNQDAALTEGDLTDLGLRYDLTVPLSRYYANYRERLPKPFKVFQIGSVWRAERPQKSRYRQFTQCDIDIIGESSINSEIELIYVTCKALSALGMGDFEIRINDRRILKAMAEACALEGEYYRHFLIALDKLDKKPLDEIMRELAEKQFSDTVLQNVKQTLKRAVDANGNMDFVGNLLKLPVDWPVLSDLRSIMETIKTTLEVPIRFDPTLVRGMDYYTGPIYEINKINQKVAIAGGGRYDKMVGHFIGQEIPACGFSLGFERIVDDLMQGGDLTTNIQSNKVVLIYSNEKDDYATVMACAEKLRKNYNVVTILPRQNNLTNQLTRLKNMGYTHFAIFERENVNINTISD